jgi:hypothetical protein
MVGSAAALDADRSHPGCGAEPAKEFDTSGKSPAHLHHRKILKARAGKLVAGFFNRAAITEPVVGVHSSDPLAPISAIA